MLLKFLRIVVWGRTLHVTCSPPTPYSGRQCNVHNYLRLIGWKNENKLVQMQKLPRSSQHFGLFGPKQKRKFAAPVLSATRVATYREAIKKCCLHFRMCWFLFTWTLWDCCRHQCSTSIQSVECKSWVSLLTFLRSSIGSLSALLFCYSCFPTQSAIMPCWRNASAFRSIVEPIIYYSENRLDSRHFFINISDVRWR